MKIKFRDGTRKRERETRVRRVNKTHATGGVPPLPLPRLPRDARRGTQGPALLPQVLGSPHSPWFLLFFFWGKTGERHNLPYRLDTIILNQTKQLLIQLIVRLLHRCTLVRALPAHALVLSLASAAAVSRSIQGTVDNTNQCSRRSKTSKGQACYLLFFVRRKRSCSTSRWNPPFVVSLLHKK